jgi:hypothetical protein
MSDRADAYRRRAEDCERAASRVSDPNIRTAYLDVAARWRRMAEQQQAIDDVLGGRRKREIRPRSCWQATKSPSVGPAMSSMRTE